MNSIDFWIRLFTGRLRLVAFGLILFFFILETFWPYLVRVRDRPRHTARNMGLMLLYILFAAPVNYLGAYWFGWVDARGFGLLHWFVLPGTVRIVLGLLFLDLGDYFYHRLSHRWWPLWGYHRVHHSDHEMDVTTGYRFHPFESLGLLSTQMISSFVFGYGLEVVVVYYTLYIPLVIAQHANLRYPFWLEKGLGLVFSTPDFHRVHHSYPREFTDSNFGDLFSIWDRVFGTYRREEATRLKLGLEEYEEDRKHGLWYMLTEPFRKR